MSLICASYGRIIVTSNNPDHYGCCSQCDPTKLTPAQIVKIEKKFEK